MHFTECEPGAYRFIERYFGDCVYSVADLVGFVLGTTAILLWVTAQLPQFIDNVKNQSAEALSIWFLAQWFLGDTLNLLGCLVSGNQLATTTALAMYFLLADVCMLTQYVYYVALQRRRKLVLERAQRRHSLKRATALLSGAASGDPAGLPSAPPGVGEDGQSPRQQRHHSHRHPHHPHQHHHHHHHHPLHANARHSQAPVGLYLADGLPTERAVVNPAEEVLVVHAAATRDAQTTGLMHAAAPTSAALVPSQDGGRDRAASAPRGARVVLGAAAGAASLMSIALLLASPPHGPAAPGALHDLKHTLRRDGGFSQRLETGGSSGSSTAAPDDPLPWYEDFDLLGQLLGSVFGYASAVLYLTSRFSQIHKNWARKSAEGLSVVMFMFTITANLCTGTSIMLRLKSAAALWEQLPWLVGAYGTVALDAFIFYQTRLYAPVPETAKAEGTDAEAGPGEVVVLPPAQPTGNPLLQPLLQP